MSSRSNNQGRAFELACLNALYEAIRKVRNCRLVENSSLAAAKRAWETLGASERQTYRRSARSIVDTIMGLEPRIAEGKDELDIYLQKDERGEDGDVRDIIILRDRIKWEIGLSIKHNNDAVKHSRLSPGIDFGEKWLGHPCSKAYWEAVVPTFEYLKRQQERGKLFRELPDKNKNVYRPIVETFMEEIGRQSRKYKDVPQGLAAYALGRYDFYKIISRDPSEKTQVQVYNLYGGLNKSGQHATPKLEIPKTKLPTRIVSIGFSPGKDNTAEIYMDGGWQLVFRIHNAETRVTPSLKFDMRIVGMPTTIITINCVWN